MKTLYININGEDVRNTENIIVIGRPEDAIVNKFYFELGKEIVKGVVASGIGEVKKKNLVTDFESSNKDAFVSIMKQWEIVKQILLGENPTGTQTITLPAEYLHWLKYHSNPIYNEIAQSLAQRGNVVEISIEKIYRNAIGILVNNIDTSLEYGQFMVNDNLVDDDSAISKAIFQKINGIVFAPYDEKFEIPKQAIMPSKEANIRNEFGDKYDEVIVDMIAEDFLSQHNVDLRNDSIVLKRLKESAKKAKIDLFSSGKARIDIPYIYPVNGTPVHYHREILKGEFNSEIEKKLLHAKHNKLLSSSSVSRWKIDENVPPISQEVGIIEYSSGMMVAASGVGFYDTKKSNEGVVYQIWDGCLSVNRQGVLLLEKLIIKEGVYTISPGAFDNCKIRQLELPSTLRMIGTRAFSNCNNLSTVVFRYGIELICDSAFASCTNLSGCLKFPDSVGIIGEYAFFNCQNLSELSLSSSIAFIGDSAFRECKSINSKVLFPKSIRYIGHYAFSGCQGIVFPINWYLIGTTKGKKEEIIDHFEIYRYKTISIGDFYVSESAWGGGLDGRCCKLEYHGSIESINNAIFLNCTMLYNKKIGLWEFAPADSEVKETIMNALNENAV